MIDTRLESEHHDSIPVTMIGRELKPLDVRTDS
ncbi:hypothetical protein A2U01_0034726 [Trifolium medium]|uniref:Uncharacterized protein n=1 Tax=Trifolium medium TaxID=97028 RepID=A0A392PPN6_9FABA|nr:hypothetical protein [Trifolium medium]